MQILLQSFKENQYPQRAVKESLAAELALSVRQVNKILCWLLSVFFFLILCKKFFVKQVSKWFDNTRWSFRHSSHFASGAAEFAPHKVTPHLESIDLSGSSLKSVPDNAICSKVEKKGQDEGSPSVTEGCNRDVTLNMVVNEDNGHIPCTETRKGKTRVGSEATEPAISSGTPKLNTEDLTGSKKCEKIAESS